MAWLRRETLPLAAALAVCVGFLVAQAARRANAFIAPDGFIGLGADGGSRAENGEEGMLERRIQGWRGLLEILGPLQGLVLDFLPTHYLVVFQVGYDDPSVESAMPVELELWELAVSFVGDPSGQLRPNNATLRRLQPLRPPDFVSSPCAFFSHDLLLTIDGHGQRCWQMPLRSRVARRCHTPSYPGYMSQTGRIFASPDGAWILRRVSGGIELRSPRNGTRRWASNLARGGPLLNVHFSPDGERFVVVTRVLAAVLNASNGREMCRRSMNFGGIMWTGAFTDHRLELCPFGGYLVSLRVRYSAEDCEFVQDGPEMPCSGVVLNAGKAWVLHIERDRAVMRDTEDTAGSVECLAGQNVSFDNRFIFSPDGGSVLLFVRGSDDVAIWRFSEGSEPYWAQKAWHFSEDGEVVLKWPEPTLFDQISNTPLRVTFHSQADVDWMSLHRRYSHEASSHRVLSMSRLRC